MTVPQIESVALLLGMLTAFLSNRVRYELVSGITLVLAVALRLIPADRAFEGFANPVIIIIASVLVVGRAIVASGTVEIVARRVLRLVKSASLQIGLLTASVAVLSAFMKNVGALGIFMPIAIQTARRGGRSPSIFLMPLAFGSLLGGTITLIGTSPNLLISAVRQETEGRPFQLFDFLPVGLPITLVGIVFLSVGWRLLPRNRGGTSPTDPQFEIASYTSEAQVCEGSPFIGKTVGEIEAIGDDTITIMAIVREGGRRYVPNANWAVFVGDVLVIQADPAALKPIIIEGKLALHGANEIQATQSKDDMLQTVEAVIENDSPMIGRSSAAMHLRHRHEVSLVAISRGGETFHQRLSRILFQAGDLIVLQGRSEALTDTLAELRCLPLADRSLTIGQSRPRFLPLLILVVAMVAITAHLTSPAMAFFGAALFVILIGAITPTEAINAIDWPVVVMLSCLIPVGQTLSTTGASALISDALEAAAIRVPPTATIALVLVASMLVTPLLHHAAAVLVMGPIAAALAHDLGFRPEPFLMAVALGGSCDFLSPIGHQNNALVMAPGGYRFGDYWRLGLPLSAIAAVLGTALIAIVWPVH